MKKLLGSVAALLTIVTAAHGADLPVKAPMMRQVAPITTWTGFYLGAHIGGAFRDNGGTLGGSNNGSFMGGGQIGADYQFMSPGLNNWVIGFEANYSALAGNNGSVALPGGFTFEDRTRGLFSATGRLGYAWGPALLYGKGGYAYRDSRTSLTGPGAVAISSTGNSRNGYTVGGGLEYMFMPSWSAKLEYQYYRFDSTTFTAPPVLVAAGSTRDEEHTIKLGLNYRFGGGAGYAR